MGKEWNEDMGKEWNEDMGKEWNEDMGKEKGIIHEWQGAEQLIRPIAPEEVYANKGLILNVAKRLGWDYHRGEDLVQKVVVKCWLDPKIRFNPNRGTFAGYLSRIARNTAVSEWRGDNRLVTMEDTKLQANLDGQVSEDEEKEVYEERRELMERGIKELYCKYPSKEGNDAFLMFSRDGIPAKQVAKKLHVTKSYVGVAVHRGVERLTEIVQKLQKEDDMRDAS